MLLNPGRVEGPKASPARSSGGFTGLVRHVVELSAVGELPVVVGDGIAVGGEGAQEPLGCAIEYVLPSSQVSRRDSAQVQGQRGTGRKLSHRVCGRSRILAYCTNGYSVTVRVSR